MVTRLGQDCLHIYVERVPDADHWRCDPERGCGERLLVTPLIGSWGEGGTQPTPGWLALFNKLRGRTDEPAE